MGIKFRRGNSVLAWKLQKLHNSLRKSRKRAWCRQALDLSELRRGAVHLAGFRRGSYTKRRIPQGNQGNVQFGGFGVETSFGVEIGVPSRYWSVLSSGVEH